jgi:hypothetical protein
MKALVVTITRRPWPTEMAKHWHIVDSFLSRHVVGSIHAMYGKAATIEEYEWDGKTPNCGECGERLA